MQWTLGFMTLLHRSRWRTGSPGNRCLAHDPGRHGRRDCSELHSFPARAAGQCHHWTVSVLVDRLALEQFAVSVAPGSGHVYTDPTVFFLRSRHGAPARRPTGPCCAAPQSGTASSSSGCGAACRPPRRSWQTSWFRGRPRRWTLPPGRAVDSCRVWVAISSPRPRRGVSLPGFGALLTWRALPPHDRPPVRCWDLSTLEVELF
jgi:hypothetical protein